MKQNGKIKENAGPVDKLISVITYIVFALFSLICIYPFYYIFINTISANDLSEKGKIIFCRSRSISEIIWMQPRFRDCCRQHRFPLQER